MNSISGAHRSKLPEKLVEIVADQNNNVDNIQKAFGKGRQSDQISRPAVDLIFDAHSSLPAGITSEKIDEFSCQINRSSL